MRKKLPGHHYEFFENSIGNVLMMREKVKNLYHRMRTAGDLAGMKIALELLEDMTQLRARLVEREQFERAEFARLFQVEEVNNEK